MSDASADIATIFARDPLKLSKQDLDAIVAKFRAGRALFNAGPSAAKGPKAPKEKLKELDLGDIEL